MCASLNIAAVGTDHNRGSAKEAHFTASFSVMSTGSASPNDKIVRCKRVMVRKRVLDHFQPPGAQVAKETGRIADPGDRVDRPTPKGLDRPWGLLSIQPDSLPRQQRHLQRSR